MDSDLLLEGERLDEIGFGGLKLIQRPEEFCYGVDAVILADYVSKSVNRNRRMEKAMDLGTGTGIIPLILSHKTALKQIFAVEIQKGSFDRACRNITLNGLAGRISAINLNVARMASECPDFRGQFDVVASNPPYMAGGAGLINPNEAKMIARHETAAGLEGFIAAAAFALRDKGEFFMVHRPSRLADICVYCRQYKLEPKELRFVSANKEEAPNILLIKCAKNGRPELKALPPLYIYREKGGSYSDEILEIYGR